MEKRLVDIYLKNKGIDVSKLTYNEKEKISILYLKLILIRQDIKRLSKDDSLYNFYYQEMNACKTQLDEEIQIVRKRNS